MFHKDETWHSYTLATEDTKKYKSRDSNWTRTHNHLVRKRILNHLAKLVKPLLKKSLAKPFSQTV